MPEKENITAIRLLQTTNDWLSPVQNDYKHFEGGKANLYPYTRPWYKHTQT